MSHLEELLGRPLQPWAQGSIPTLNDLGPEMLEEGRRLAKRSPVVAARYLEYHVARAVEAPDFVDEVLLGSADPTTWGTRDVLCFVYRDDALLSLSVDDMVETLREVSGERWWRSEPLLANWTSWGDAGAPAVFVRGARYWWRNPGGTHDVSVTGRIERIESAGFTTASRRWLASRIAWRARDYLAARSPSVDGLLSALGASPGQLSKAGQIALDALLREASRPADSLLLAPGFRGPDEWYSM
jgi:hypothetical protein